MMTTLRSGRPAGFSSPEQTGQATPSPFSIIRPRAARRQGTGSRLRAATYVGLSALACAATLAWMLTAPNSRAGAPDPVSAAGTAEAVNQRIFWGGLGALISLGLGMIGIYYWPHPGKVRVRKQDTSLSTYDSVTGLPTQRLFLVLLSQALSRAESTQRIVAVLIVELAQFCPSSPTDTVPNKILVERVQAARIKSALQSHDAVARLGEHRFAVIIDNLNEPKAAVSIAETIQHTLSLPLLVEGQEFLLSCRIGGVVAPFDGTEGQALLDAAAQLLASSQPNDASIKFLSDSSRFAPASRDPSSPQRTEDTRRQPSLTLHR